MATYNDPQNTIRPDTPRNAGNYDAPHITPITPAEDFRTIMLNRISWGAVFGGVVMAMAVQIVLNLIGIGIGASAIDPATGAVDIESLGLGAMIWWTISGICAALAGGFTAGRLAGEPKESTAGWHGLTSWAASVLLVAVLMITAAGGSVLAGNYQVLADVNGNRTNIYANNNDVAGLPEYTPGQPTFGTATDDMGTVGSTTMNAPAGSAAAETVDNEAAADAMAGASLFSAFALILGAIAAWFGGRAGAVDPTVTRHDPRSTQPLH